MMKKIIRKVLSISIIIAMIAATMGTAFAETQINFYEADADINQSITYMGDVVAIVNQSPSSESKVSGYYTDIERTGDDINFLADDTENSISSDPQIAGVIGTRINPEDGSEIYATEPDFDDITPLENKEEVQKELANYSIADESVSVGSTKKIVDGDGYYRTMECLYIGSKCTVWGCTSDTLISSELTLSSANAAKIGRQFDLYCQKTVDSFGEWLDVDDDGKVAIYCFDIEKNYVNGIGQSYTAGYFMGANLVDSSGYINGVYVGTTGYELGTDCICLDTYPGMSSQSDVFGYVEDSFSTLVHEFQHMINYSYMYRGGESGYYEERMETYLNEAFSMAAEHMVLGPGATASRIDWFNSSDYSRGSALTYWGSTLDNYANSYLFGQYLRTRYAQKTGSHDGNDFFRMVLNKRQETKGGNTLTMISNILETTPNQLVMDFWAAVYLKQSSGIYGFNGETWANSISPIVYSTSPSNKSIYNGGAVFYQTNGSSLTVNSKSNVGFITFKSGGEVEMSGAPTLSNMSLNRTAVDKATLSFESSKAGRLWYALSETTVNDKNALYECVSINKGNTTLELDVSGGEAAEPTFYYYLESNDGDSGDLTSIKLNAYSYVVTIEENERGSISVFHNNAAVNSGDRIRTGEEITITAEPGEGFVLEGLYVNQNRLDGNSVAVAENTAISAKFLKENVPAATSFAGGDGTELNPYLISNVAEFKYFANEVNSGNSMEGIFIALSDDIDFEGNEYIVVGQTKENAFKGHLNGDYHYIRNIDWTFENEPYVGLFGYLSGTVENLKAENCKMMSNYSSGTGYVGMLAGYNAGTVRFCYLEGSADGNKYETVYIGGAAGYNTGIIEDSAVGVEVRTDDKALVGVKFTYAGGVAGYNAASGTIARCEVSKPSLYSKQNESVTLQTARRYTGGVAGFTAGSITDCIRTAPIMENNSKGLTYTGGIAGYQAAGEIRRCYVYSPNKGTYSFCSISDNYLGGIVGYQASNGTVDSCVSYQERLSSVYQGTKAKVGHIAASFAGTITNCYYWESEILYGKVNNASDSSSEKGSYLLNYGFLRDDAEFDLYDVWEIEKRPETDYPTLKSARRFYGNRIYCKKYTECEIIIEPEWAYEEESVYVSYVYDDNNDYVVEMFYLDGEPRYGPFEFVASGSHTITADFIKLYTVDTEESLYGDIVSSKQKVYPGSKIKVSVQNQSPEYGVKYYTMNGRRCSRNKFSPDEDCTVGAVFEAFKYYGDLSTDIHWGILNDGINDILYVFGEGAMPELGYYTYREYQTNSTFKLPKAGYYKYYGQIDKIVVQEGITSLSEYAFIHMGASEIEIADSVRSIGSYALVENNFENVLLSYIVDYPSNAVDCTVIDANSMNYITTIDYNENGTLRYPLRTVEDGVTITNKDLSKTIPVGYEFESITVNGEPLSDEGITTNHYYPNYLTFILNLKKMADTETGGNITDDAYWYLDDMYLVCHGEGTITIDDTITSHCEKASTLIVKDGITEICATSSLNGGINTIVLPASIETIGDNIITKNIKHIYYEGTMDDWDKVSVGTGNTGLSTSQIKCFNSFDELIYVRVKNDEGGIVSPERNIGLKGETIKVTPDPNAGYQFETISINGIPNNCSEVVLTDDITISATFVPLYEVKILEYGTCGTSLKWAMYENGMLLFAGKGAMKSFEEGSSPWYKYKDQITNIVFSDEMSSIGSYAFSGCSALEEIEIPESISYIGFCAFESCGFERVTMKCNIDCISYSAFSRCDRLKTIVLPEGTRYIMSYAFYHCDELENVIMPEGLTQIQSFAFYSCPKLKHVDFPKSLEEISYQVFEKTGILDGLEYLELNEGIETIGASAFPSNTTVKYLILPSTVKTIGSSSGKPAIPCSGITDVFYHGTEEDWEKVQLGKVDDYIRNARMHYFSNREDVVQIQVTVNGHGKVSAGCNAAVIGESVDLEIEPDIGYKLDSVIVNGKKIDGISIDIQGETEVQVTFSTVVEGAEVSDTGTCGSDIQYALFSDGTLYIEGTGVMNDYSQTNLVPWNDASSGINTAIFGGEVTVIGDYTFEGMENLRIVKLPEGVSSIGEYALSNCKNLNGVFIPRSVQTIEQNAFYNTPVQDVYYIGSEEDWNTMTISATGNSSLINAARHYISGLNGDFNNDGKVDQADAIALKYYLADWDGYKDMDPVQADVNSDRELNLADILLLERYLVGWKGYDIADLWFK